MTNFLLGLFIIFNVYAVSASDLTSCRNYLNLSSKPLSIYETVSERLVDNQVRLYNEQTILIESVLSQLQKRSLVLEGSNRLPIPEIRDSTIIAIHSWRSKDENDPDRKLLESQILDDPYLTYLKSNWVDKRADHLTALHADFSSVRRIDGLAAPTILPVPGSILDYLYLHTRFQGPMMLRTELLILRIMKDHDPRLTFDQQQDIDRIFEIERYNYLVSRLSHSLAAGELGKINDWDKYFNIKSVYSAMMATKSKIRLSVDGAHKRNFLKAQLERRVRGDISFVDYIAFTMLQVSNDSAHRELYRDFMVLKIIIRLTQAISSAEEFESFLSQQVDSARATFLY